MKLFQQSEIKEALKWVKDHPNNSALHLHRFIGPNAPTVFKTAIKSGQPIAHLFSQDKKFLKEIAVRSGVKRIVIEREGTDRQHIDLCCTPLKRVLEEMGYSMEDFTLRK